MKKIDFELVQAFAVWAVCGVLCGVGLLVFFALLAGCAPLPVVHEPTPPVEDHGTVEDCDAACANLARLQCPGHQGSPGHDGEFGTADDIPCAEACRRIVEADAEVVFAQRCIAAALNCDGADQCFVEAE